MRSMMAHPLIARLAAHDRAIYARVAVGAARRAHARPWQLVTHLGGATASTLAAVLPAAIGIAMGGDGGGRLVRAAILAAAALLLAQLVVHVAKRWCVRPRPTPADPACVLAAVPDRFSFPSGHSAAAMALAIGYGIAFPALLPPLAAVAVLVGVSRVRLGVHYPGDVLAGFAIALLVGTALHAIA